MDDEETNLGRQWLSATRAGQESLVDLDIA